MESWHDWTYRCWIIHIHRNDSAKWKLFCLAWQNRCWNHKQRLLQKNMLSDRSSRRYFPPCVLKTYFTVSNLLLSSRIINHSCHKYFVTRLHKVLITLHRHFYHSVTFTAATTLRIGNLLLLNAPCNLSARLKNVQIFYKCLNVIFTVRWNKLWNELVPDVSTLWLEQCSCNLWGKQELEGKWVMSSRKDSLRKYSQLKAWVVGLLGVGIMSSVFARSLAPSDMLNTLESQLENTVISVVLTVDMNDSFNIGARHVNLLGSLKKHVHKAVFCLPWAHYE